MPWKFEKLNEDFTFYIKPNITYDVGRLTGTVTFNDKSISRKHAEFKWSPENDLTLTDFSKFGTSVNGKALEGGTVKLAHNDIIKFGAQPGVDVKFTFEKMVVVSSYLVQQDKLSLVTSLNNIGTKLMTDWADDVDYVVMSSLRVTYKVICALIKQIHIVTPDFFKVYSDFYRGILKIQPDPAKFLPNCVDPRIKDDLVQFAPQPARTTLFSGQTFYFLSIAKQVSLELSVHLSGGLTQLLSSVPDSDLDSVLSSPNSLLIFDQLTDYNTTAAYKSLCAAGRRPILDAELGFAVLYCSSQMYCNSLRPCPDNVCSDMDSLLHSLPAHINPFLLDGTGVSGPRKRPLSVNEFVSTNKRQRCFEKLENTIVDLNPIIDKRPVLLPVSNNKPCNTMTVDEDDFDSLEVPCFKDVPSQEMKLAAIHYPTPVDASSLSNENIPPTSNDKLKNISEFHQKLDLIPTTKIVLKTEESIQKQPPSKNVVYESLVKEDLRDFLPIKNYKTFVKTVSTFHTAA